MAAYSWDELAGLTLRRQFPAVRGTGRAAIVETMRRIGPIQSQVARSTFVSLAARLPGVRYADIVDAHESFDLVRGSSLRGTVHTCARDHHGVVDAVTRRAMAVSWRRALRLQQVEVADVQDAIEAYATGEWRSPEQLRAHLVSWLNVHESPAAIEAAGAAGQGRAMAHVHSAMIRRPADGTAWERQTAPVYRSACDVLGVEKSDWLADPGAALAELVRVHLTSYGPANRRDIAWWSGSGLRQVDAALATLGDELTQRPGPDGQTYYDLASLRADIYDPGVRLLAEFDATVVGYDPKTRDRFFDSDHLEHFWVATNGAFTAVLLVDGRLAGSWNLAGSGEQRRIELRMFPDKSLVSAAALTPSVEAVDKALGVRISDVEITRIHG